MKKVIFIIGFAATSFVFPASATIIHVPSEQATIQAGIDASTNGDTVLVASGTYQEHISFNGKAIILTSEEGPDSTLIIPLTGGLELVAFRQNEDSLSVLQGFKLNNSTGRAIYCQSSNPIIQGNLIANNFISGSNGAAIFGSNSSAIIRNNIIKNSQVTSGHGGALYFTSSAVSLVNNIITNNACTGYGGGLLIQDSHDCSIKGNIIDENSATGGGGISLIDCTGISLSNNTIYHNSSGGNQPYYFGSGIHLYNSTYTSIKNNIVMDNYPHFGIARYLGDPYSDTISYNDFYTNTPDNYSSIVPGTGSIIENPLFLNQAAGDYSLLPESPCIDAGDPLSPLDPDGTRTDMGALYYDQTYKILAFQLILPQENSILTEMPVQFIWHFTTDIDSGYPVFYSHYIDDNILFESPEISTELSDTTYTLPDTLIRSERYYWRINAYNYHAAPIWSDETWNFYIDGYPLLPSIIAPPDGAFADESSYLSWLISIDPDIMDNVTYRLQVDNNSDFSSPEISVGGLANTNIILDEAFAVQLGGIEGFDNLQEDQIYYWRVRADDSFGLSSDYTDGSNNFIFGSNPVEPNNSPYPPLSGFSPFNADEVASAFPMIYWHHAYDPDEDDDSTTLRYIIQLDDDGEFDTSFTYEYTTSIGQNFINIADSLSEDMLWIYHIRTMDDGDLLSNWSVIQSFWVNYNNQSPVAPMAGFYPSEGQIINSPYPEIMWNHASDPDPSDGQSALHYEIELDTDGEFELDAIYIYSTSPGINSFAVPDSLTDEIWYYRIRTLDDFSAQSGWTPIQYFDVNTLNHPPLPPISGFSPSSDEEIISLTPTITWDDATDSDPDDYSDNLHYCFHLIEDTSTGGYQYYDTTDIGINQVAIAEEIPDNSHFLYAIKTIDDEGLESEWSELQWFWTNHYNYPPEPFPLISPEPDLRWVDYYTYFNWGRSADYDPLASFNYTLQISPDSLFNNFVLTRSGLTDTSRIMITDTLAIAGGNLYWRVFATDDDSLIRFGGLPEPEVRKLTIFPAGDANTDGNLIGSDVTYLVAYFRGLNREPNPPLAGDTNGDCNLIGSDVTYLVQYFRGRNLKPERGDCEAPVLTDEGLNKK